MLDLNLMMRRTLIQRDNQANHGAMRSPKVRLRRSAKQRLWAIASLSKYCLVSLNQTQ